MNSELYNTNFENNLLSGSKVMKRQIKRSDFISVEDNYCDPNDCETHCERP